MTDYKLAKKNQEVQSKVQSQNAFFDKLNGDLDLIIDDTKPKSQAKRISTQEREKMKEQLSNWKEEKF